MTITLLDGGMGQELILRSKADPTPLWATQIMMEQPELVEAVHSDYFNAGAELATTNSYAIHRDRLVANGVEELFIPLQIRACEIANRARDLHGSGLVAGAIGPTGASYRPELALEVEQGAEIYAEIAKLQADHVDLILLETLVSFKQARGAAMGATSAGKPVWLSVSVDDDDGSKLRSGESILDVLSIAKEFNLDALLINCSMPEAVTTALQTIGEQSFKVGAYANGFTKISDAFKQDNPTVDALESRKDLDPNSYADFAQSWINNGTSIVGGCCEAGPNHIAELAQRFK